MLVVLALFGGLMTRSLRAAESPQAAQGHAEVLAAKPLGQMGPTGPKLLVGGDHEYPPFEFLEDGEPSGFNIELIRAVAEVMNYDVEIRLGPWHQVREDLEQGRIDVLAGMYYSENRDRKVEFSVPHVMVSPGLFVRQDSPAKSLEDLRGRAIIVQQRDIMHDLLERTRLTSRIVTVASPTEGLRLLASGKHDGALLSSKMQGLYIVDRLELTNLKAVRTALPSRRYSFAVAEGNTELLYRLNEGLNILKATGKYQEIYDAWFGVYEQRRLLAFRVFAVALGGIAALLVVSLLWSWTLQQQVRRRTAELRSSEERFRVLVEQAPEAILVHDIDENRFIHANRNAERLFGCPREELLRSGPQRFYAPRQPDGRPIDESMREHVERALSGEELTFERIIHPLAGGETHCEVRLVPLPSTGNRLLRASYLDITERKRAEEITRLEETRLKSTLKIAQHPATSFRDLLDVALDQIVALSGSKLGYIFHYQEAKREFTLYAWSKEAMQECNVSDPLEVYHLEQTGIWGEPVRRRGPVVINDFQAPHPLKRGTPKGHVPLTRFLSVPVFSEGQIVAVVGVANKPTDYTETDVKQLTLMMDWFWRIAEQRQAEDALRASEERFRALIEQAPEAILVYDAEAGRFIHANRNAERLFGCPREEILQSGLKRFYVPDQPDGRPLHESIQDDITQGLAEEALAVERVIHPLTGGEVYCDVRVVRLPSARGALLRVSYIDITDRKQAEEELRKHRDHLEELIEERTAELATANKDLAQRTEQLRALAVQLTEAEQRERRRIAYVLHEHFQQLLVAAKYSVQLLRDKGYPQAASQALESLDQAIEVSRSLTVELRPPVLYELGLGPALEWLGRHCREKYALDVQLQIDRQAEPASDSLRTFLFEAARELLLNVAKHAQAPSARLCLERLDDRTELAVVDHGVGFDLSETAGNGFGLFSIRERLEALGGRMEVDSAPGKGTHVRLSVPIREPDTLSRAF